MTSFTSLTLEESGKLSECLRYIARGQWQERITNLSQYLKRFKDAVDYDKFRAMGLPIGSGEVESAHRYIPQKRLKIPGATWHPDTVNPMLALRIIRANGWWEDFWMETVSFCTKTV